MGARESKLARQTRAAMSPNSYDEPTRQLMDIRLKLLSGDAASVIDQLTQMQAQHPEDAYLAYYLACAQLMLAQKLDNPAEAYKKASVLMAAARDRAPGPALRIRADREVNWVKSILSGDFRPARAVYGSDSAPGGQIKPLPKVIAESCS